MSGKLVFVCDIPGCWFDATLRLEVHGIAPGTVYWTLDVCQTHSHFQLDALEQFQVNADLPWVN